jgi:hypothetical protein
MSALKGTICIGCIFDILVPESLSSKLGVVILSAGSELDLGWYDTDPHSRSLIWYVTLVE